MTPPSKRPWRFIFNWFPLGNLLYGDCTVAGYYHCLMALAVLNGSTFQKILYRIGFKPPSAKYVIQEYTAYLATLSEKPSAEQGVGPDGWLDWQEAQGNVLGWKYVVPAGSGAIPEADLRRALNNFGAVMLCGCLTEFSYQTMPKVWYLRAGDVPSQNLGHLVAYLDNTAADDRCVTWGKWQNMTIAYRELCLNAAFVFVHKSDPQATEKLALLATL